MDERVQNGQLVQGGKMGEEGMEVSTHEETLSASITSESERQIEETAAAPALHIVCEAEDSDDDSKDSDSDSSSSSSSSWLSVSGPAGHDDDEGFSQPAPIKTRDEVLIEELPAVEEVCVSLPEDAELQPVGIVSSIIQQLVIIQSLKDAPPLNDDSILFRSDRVALAKVFEVFGPVSSPLYILRFNSADLISSKGLTEGLTVYYAPAMKEYTGYILVQELKLLKGSDASWKNDHEPPVEALDYSDDEKEQEAKRKVKNSRKKDNNPDNCDRSTQNTLQQKQPDRQLFPPRQVKPVFRRQNPRNKHQTFRQTPPPPHVYQPMPSPYPLPSHPFPPPSFPFCPPPTLPPPPPPSNPSFSCPVWLSNAVPYVDLFPPPPPPPPQ